MAKITVRGFVQILAPIQAPKITPQQCTIAKVLRQLDTERR